MPGSESFHFSTNSLIAIPIGPPLPFSDACVPAVGLLLTT
jgi:hypothetical protein